MLICFYSWCICRCQLNPAHWMECLRHVARPGCLFGALLHLPLDRQCLRFLSLQLTQKISSVSDRLVGLSNSHNYCGSLTQSSMCYSSRVVMGCQKQPWQMQLFSLWNGRVGVTLPTAIIVPFPPHLQNLFWRHNSKAGCLICKMNVT